MNAREQAIETLYLKIANGEQLNQSEYDFILIYEMQNKPKKNMW